MRQLAPIVGLLLLAACAEGSEGAACNSDADCAGGLRCFDERCLDLGQPEGRIVWQVLPPAESGQVAATFAAQGNPLDLHLCAAQKVTGSLDFAGSARLVAEGELGGVPGACAGFERRVEGEFSIPLAAGLWRLILHPPGDAPPIVRTLEVSRCKDVDLGPISPPETVRSLHFLPLIDPVLDPRPRCGIRARVLDPGTGLPLSAPVEVRAEADGSCEVPAEGLALRFQEPEGGKRVLLRLENLDAAAPTFRGVESEAELPSEGPVELGPVAVGRDPPERVLIAVRDPQGAPVRDAKVRALWPPPADRAAAPPCFRNRRASEGGDPSFFHSPVAEPAGEWGLYELWLPPGPYLLLAEAPEGALLAAGGRCQEGEERCAIEVRAGESQRVGLGLEERLSVRGRVLLPNGGAFPGARVLATPRGWAGPERSAVANSAGRYELFLDPGAYDLLVLPERSDLPLSRQSLPTLVAPREQDLGVARAALVAGRLRVVAGDESLPLADALVRAWRLDATELPALAGETLSDGEGRFYLTLPAR